ncbi:nucleotidyltransferase domain-containing protein [Bacillus sp. FJAT-22090]|uniref:nucleotidyltransferase domain-containing protein n=1 Tax=Bacillus sp. FJAT-22090 TaxID=1581038 RepID=UPI00119D6A84|nr:nucleotidyltransferase domain-containing protein [Bacillus sp. FJAT-22090]
MNARLSKSVEEFMNIYIELLNKHLPKDLIEGVYLYGSISLGAFKEENSDIDFIVLLKRSVNEEEIDAIKVIHSQLNNHEFGRRMDGVYIQANLVGKTNEELPPYPFCTEGKVSIGHWDVNHITWWVLKQYGITLQGAPIVELPIPTKWEDVLETLKYNINQYWFSKSQKRNPFFFDSMVEFTICTISRIICSLERREIVSKDQALDICKDLLPERWHLLLQEGSRIRNKDNKKSLYKSKIKRAKDCRDFILYTHELCNKKYFLEE